MNARLWLAKGELLREAAVGSPPPPHIHLPVKHAGEEGDPPEGFVDQARFELQAGGADGECDYMLASKPAPGWRWVAIGGQIQAHRITR